MPRKLRLLTVSARSTRLRPPSIGRSTAPRNGAHSPARRPGAPGRACVRGYSVLPSRCPLFGRNAWQRHQVPSLLGLGCGAAGFPIFAVARN
jgi:hypothetical protein